jgi:hypothetical protein
VAALQGDVQGIQYPVVPSKGDCAAQQVGCHTCSHPMCPVTISSSPPCRLTTTTGTIMPGQSHACSWVYLLAAPWTVAAEA